MGIYEPQITGLVLKRRTPPVVSQGDAAICWAASLNSWLTVTVDEFGAKSGTWLGEKAKKNFIDGAPWDRKVMDFEQMKQEWKDLMTKGGSATPDGIAVMAVNVGMETEL